MRKGDTMPSGMRVQDHYARTGITERVVAAIRAANGEDAPITPEALAPIDHFHGRGVAATEELARRLNPQPGDHVLDIGCGIGGPARWIAYKFGCRVSGVDLTQEFCTAARELNDITGMSRQVSILEGSALALPLPDATFDRVYSQNAVMNIEDKAAAYREAFRVLKPGGVLALAHLNAGPNGPPVFPQPWASVPENSFLADDEETTRDIRAAGFVILSFTDRSDASLAAQTALRHKLGEQELPVLGVHVVHGQDFLRLQTNTLRALEEGRIRPVEVLARKPTLA
jgi:sarcosine/dimethylglycine N-methyltransferase